jgi:hypothetical protein
MKCLNVSEFSFKTPFYLSLLKKMLTFSLDLDPDTELDPDPHTSKKLDPDPDVRDR